MRTDTITILWICPSCGKDTEVKVWPLIPAKVTGPPEYCHPAEGGEIDPANCANCDAPIDVGTALEDAAEVDCEARQAAAEARWESKRDDEMMERAERRRSP